MGAGEVEWIARGLLTRADEILLCRNRKHGYSYLPGGHVEFGEGAPDALSREFVEEAGIQIIVGRPLLVAELRFTQKGRERHEVTVVFHVEHPVQASVTSQEPEIEFHWVPRGEIAVTNLRPPLMKRWLSNHRVTDSLAWLTADERQ